MMTIPIFIGWDDKEPIAYHVLAHSILKRSSLPVSITPLNRANLGGQFWRKRAEVDSTDFSNSRFIVPHLMEYDGWAIFMDCDMLCLGDIADLWNQRDDRYSVMVKKHTHTPKEETKFLDQIQSKYARKNWSSLMMFNSSNCRELTKHAVNGKPGLWMHRFEWLEDEEIGEIKGLWNHLIGVQGRVPQPKLVHWTLGGPWHKHEDSYTQVWWDEYEDMLQGNNPVRYRDEQA